MVWLPTMQSNIDDYKDEMDSVGRFIRECCELDESYSVQSSDIHKDYSAWSDKPMNITEFGREMGKHRFAKKRRCGLKLINIGIAILGGLFSLGGTYQIVQEKWNFRL